MLAFSMLLPVGCDKIKEATSHNFSVRDVKIDFTAITQPLLVESQTNVPVMRAGSTSSFLVTRTVNLSDFGSTELMDYANRITKVVVNNSTVDVSTVPAGNFKVTNLKIKYSETASGSLTISEYTVGETFTPPSTMGTFLGGFVLKLVHDRAISVTVSGETDAPVGTEINVSYEGDIVFTASVL